MTVMNTLRSYGVAGATLLMMATASSFAQTRCGGPDAAREKRIADIIATMTIEEKTAQMRQFHASSQRVEGRQSEIELDDKGKLSITDGARKRYAFGIGGIKSPGEKIDPVKAATLTNALQRDIIATSRQGIPSLFVAESYSGLNAEGATKFARPINMAATFNPTLVGDAWDVVGRESRLRGFNMLHSPVADIHRDPRFGRMSEGFGEDTFLTTSMILASVRAVQGNRDGKTKDGIAPTHVGAVTKHFVGYGQVEGGRNFATSTISPRDLEDQYFPPFMAAVRDACTLGIMPAHGDINGVASHGNPWLLREVLRDRWGFDGYTVSDAEDIARLGFFMGVAENDKEAAKLGLRAGVDIDLYSDRAYVHLPELVSADPSLMPLMDKAVANVLRTKMKLGLFDKPYVDPRRTAKETRSASALATALTLDLESMTLLKNAGNLLPLDPAAPRTIALVGPLIDKNGVAALSAAFGKSAKFVVEPGLKLTNNNLLDAKLASDESNRAGFDRAVAQARQADLSIVFIGDDVFTSKEAFFMGDVRGDRASLDPVGLQTALVEAVKAVGKPVIVVLKHRRTLTIGRVVDNADAVLDIWEPGERGMEALGMILTGKASPSGRLPVTIPRTVGQLPAYYSQKRINYRKNYLFEEIGPLYPFGYGLTYTQFSYSDLKLSAPVMKPGAPITASMTLTNSGARAGKEVVQLYISDPVATVTRPMKELKAFQKVELAPGQRRTISFTITPDMLAHTGADMKTDPGYGAFDIEIAPSAGGGGVAAKAEYQP